VRLCCTTALDISEDGSEQAPEAAHRSREETHVITVRRDKDIHDV
jgi:hypothetical protein